MIFFGITLVEAKQHKFEMTIDDVTIKVAPKLDYKVFAFNGQVPAPLIHVKEGDNVEVFVTNNTSMPHTIHWHGFHMKNNWKYEHKLINPATLLLAIFISSIVNATTTGRSSTCNVDSTYVNRGDYQSTHSKINMDAPVSLEYINDEIRGSYNTMRDGVINHVKKKLLCPC